MIVTYHISVHGRTMKLSDHFQLGEFQCHSGADTVLINPDLIKALEKVRSWANSVLPGCKVIVTSGYRTPAHNKAIGGAENSQHCLGNAADIKVMKPNGEYVSPQTVHDALDSGAVTGLKWDGGLGLYATWVHMDVRGKRARWKG
jgi:uncharacterized protein YcbK (DUF882 family)